MNAIAANRSFARQPDEGEARWWFGSLTRIKATAEETGGHLSLVEVELPPYAPVPLHVHHGEDEGFYVLEGSASFRVGDDRIDAGPNTFLFGPRDVPHAFTAGPDGVRLLYLFMPGGFEGFIRETSEPAARLEIPPAEVVPEGERVGAALSRYDAEILD
jgi:quercetin dioxygenase-like cupin family protein